MAIIGPEDFMTRVRSTVVATLAGAALIATSRDPTLPIVVPV